MSTQSKKNWRTNNPKRSFLEGAKWRAKIKNIPFSITVADIPDIPTHCPVLGIPLFRRIGYMKRDGTDDNSPSLDRIKPELGYVPGNLAIISNKANIIKSNWTADDLRKTLKYVEEHERIIRRTETTSNLLGKFIRKAQGWFRWQFDRNREDLGCCATSG